MAVSTITPRQQIRDALEYAREARHHTGCNCWSYRDHDGEGYCTDREAVWARAINKLLDDCLT